MGNADMRSYSAELVSPYPTGSLRYGLNQRLPVHNAEDRFWDRKKLVKFNPKPTVSRLPCEDELRRIQSLINCVNTCRRCCQLFPSLCSDHIYKGIALMELLFTREGHVYSHKSDHGEEVEVFSCYALARTYLNHMATVRPLLSPSPAADPPRIQFDSGVRHCSRQFVRESIYVDDGQNYPDYREWRPRTEYWTHRRDTQRWSVLHWPEKVYLRGRLWPESQAMRATY